MFDLCIITSRASLKLETTDGYRYLPEKLGLTHPSSSFGACILKKNLPLIYPLLVLPTLLSNFIPICI